MHHDAEPDDITHGADVPPHDGRATGFAPGGRWSTCPPSAELAQVLESASGADWRCSGAADDEMVGMARRWAAIESWAGAGKLRAIRELIRREDKPGLPGGQPDPWSESLTHELALALATSAGSADQARACRRQP